MAILNLQRNETMVAKVYDLLHPVWKTYHSSPKSRHELNVIGEERGVRTWTPSSVKRARWIPHVQQALSVFLLAGKGGSLSADSGQYTAVLHHMEHLASSADSAEVKACAKKMSFSRIIAHIAYDSGFFFNCSCSDYEGNAEG